jgi:TPP-dependent indolepyruvate ferredoxin oxidoreductase alpha subunit
VKKYAINQKRCDGSPFCPVRRECPANAIHEVDGGFYIDMNVCLGCGVCVKYCPRRAVEEIAS